MHANEDFKRSPRHDNSAVPGDGHSAGGVAKRAKEILRLGGLTEDEVTIMQGVFACGTTKAHECVVPFDSPQLYMLPAEATVSTVHTQSVIACDVETFNSFSDWTPACCSWTTR